MLKWELNVEESFLQIAHKTENTLQCALTYLPRQCLQTANYILPPNLRRVANDRLNGGHSFFQTICIQQAIREETSTSFPVRRGYRFDFCLNGDVLILHALPEGRKVITAPTIALAMPPKSSHSVLLVGAPVKAREMLELAESDAFRP